MQRKTDLTVVIDMVQVLPILGELRTNQARSSTKSSAGFDIGKCIIRPWTWNLCQS